MLLLLRQRLNRMLLLRCMLLLLKRKLLVLVNLLLLLSMCSGLGHDCTDGGLRVQDGVCCMLQLPWVGEGEMGGQVVVVRVQRLAVIVWEPQATGSGGSHSGTLGQIQGAFLAHTLELSSG